MPDAFQDLDQVLEIQTKQLPIGGKVIDFPDRISAKSGTLLLLLHREAAKNPKSDPKQLAERMLTEDQMADLMTDVLGRKPEEFLPEVGMDGRRMLHVFQTLMIWHLAGEDLARVAWNNPGKLPALPTKKAAPSRGKARSGRQGSRA